MLSTDCRKLLRYPNSCHSFLMPRTLLNSVGHSSNSRTSNKKSPQQQQQRMLECRRPFTRSCCTCKLLAGFGQQQQQLTAAATAAAPSSSQQAAAATAAAAAKEHASQYFSRGHAATAHAPLLLWVVLVKIARLVHFAVPIIWVFPTKARGLASVTSKLSTFLGEQVGFRSFRKP